jgi:hypothetical protein
MKIEQNEQRKRKREKRKNEGKIIVVMASRRRAMKELGRVTFSCPLGSSNVLLSVRQTFLVERV